MTKVQNVVPGSNGQPIQEIFKFQFKVWVVKAILW